MKKLLTLAALVGTAVMSFGQGQISWNNTSGTLISLNGAALAPSTSAATTYNFGLFIAPAGTAAPTGLNDANWLFVGAYAVNSTAAAGAGRLTNPGTATIAGYGIGTTVAFIIRGWQSTTGGADYAAAIPGLTAIGTSALGSALLGGGAIPLPSAFGTSGGGAVGGFNMVGGAVVPEPSSMVLAGLGAASLLLFRRRK